MQKQSEDLAEKQKALQEQTAQLAAMTADRDKWMTQSQQLVVSACWSSHSTAAAHSTADCD